LEHAKNLGPGGNYLIVGLDSDERVRASKGPKRPYNKLDDRVRIMMAFSIVDEVKTYEDDDQLRSHIVDLCIDVIVVGSEYIDRVIGQELCRVEYFNRIGNYSTTNLINNKI